MNHPRTKTTQPPRGRSSTNQPLTADLLSFPAILDRMTPVERLRAYRAGTFSRSERTIWAARFPEEAPLLNGELEWIARNLADLD